MSLPANPIVIIPARMHSTRLPGKPLAEIHGEAMIVHVWRRGVEADVGPVVVACAEPEIADAIEQAGGKAILTRPDHASGSDRIFEALGKADPDRKHDAVVNVQGDLPTVAADVVRASLKPLEKAEVGIATIAAIITEPSERANPNVVKAVIGLGEGRTVGRAHYFSRATVPAGDGPLYHHIGLYTFRREALEAFVGLPRGVLEARERLEQLRALENGIRIDVALVDTVPLGVDTPADLERARGMLASTASR
ncbi:MAG: 3-deoxy-manno-octulosonate cytidylyltransferase [Rhodospirillales bacterium]|nr:3-deoxy-manno-octulosonate cytidylyltransferase [Rhodospirillales bacterium]